VVGISIYGARLGYMGPFRTIQSLNHSSALRIPNDIHENLITEISAGRVKRINELPPYYISSPIGAVQKRSNGIFTGWRRIHDLSYPPNASVNNGIPKHFGSLKYQTIDHAIALIAKHGRGVRLHKRDLKDAFRKIPVSPYDHWLLLFEWQGQFYVDICLPFGLSTSPFLFNLFAEGLHWILEYVYSQSVVHYLDDFLLVAGDNDALFGQVCEYLGLEEKPSKSIDGSVVDFTGIEIDSERMEVRLPKDKHMRALKGVEDMLRHGSTNFITLRSLIGFLSFCAKVVPLGRPFLRNLFNFLYTLAATGPYSTRRLSTEAKRDLSWWSSLLRNWHGKQLIRKHRTSYFIYTDASGSKGIGGWWGSQAFSSRMPRRHRSKHINWKEAYAILFALAKWGQQLAGCQVTFMCDNSSIVDAINKTSIRGEAINPLQLILLTAALHDIVLHACWLSSEENWIADALSRFNLKRLANFKLNELFKLPHREPGTPILSLRRRLQTYFGTDLPQLHEQPMSQLGTTMSNSPLSMDTAHSQSPSKHYQIGSQRFLTQGRQKQSHSTSLLSKANISTSASQQQCLTILESNACYKDHFVYSVQGPSENEERSPDHFFLPW
jgi:hypothetical protein